MPYLVLTDYNKQIQTDNLNNILGNDDSVRLQSELSAQAEITSYLVQKYDIGSEFNNTLIWSPTVQYKANQLVNLSGYPAFSALTASYPLNSLVTYNGQCYICIVAVVAAGAWTGNTNWQLLGNVGDFYFIPYPYRLFSLKYGCYNIGDMVYWCGNIYQCLIATTWPSHFSNLQNYTTQNIPFNNIFPNDPINGATYWGAGTPYSITGFAPNQPAATAWSSATTYSTGQYVTYNGGTWQSLTNLNLNLIPGSDIINWQPLSWTFGDNRDQQIVQYMIDITLYHIHSRISPRNIPELRVKRYDDAKSWLKNVATNDWITSSVPKKQPPQGNRVRQGGDVKKDNGY